MRKSFVSLLSLVLFLGVLLTVGCGGGGGGGGGSSPVSPIADGSLADLKGRVTYNGNAAPKAIVYLMKTTSDETELSRRASILNSIEPDISVLTADGKGYQTTSDANGYYSFTQVPIGNYTVQALISPSIQVSQPVVLGAISNLDLALKPTGSISGKITLGGNPVQGMVALLQGSSLTPLYSTVVGMDGSFKILYVPVETTPYTLIPVIPGSYYEGYSVRASYANASTAGQAPAQPAASAVKGSVRATSPAGGYTFEKAPVQVTPIAGKDYPLGTLELVAAESTITGTAKFQGATTHIGISVWTEGGSTSTIDAAGNYTLEGISFGQHTIHFSGLYNGKSYSTSTIVLVDSLTKTVDTVTLLPDSATKAKIDVSLSGLTGSSYVSFELWQQNDSDPTESNGSYSPATFPYTGLEPGTYYVKVYPGSDYSLLNPAAGSTDLLASITVAAGGNASFVARLKYNKSNLSGTISNIGANFPLSDPYAYLNPGGHYAYVSGDGSYSFTAITPGVYTLSLSAKGYTTYSSSITLTAGNNTKSFFLTQTFPIVSNVSYTAPTVTVTGDRLDTASMYIAPQGGSFYSYPPSGPSPRTLSTMNLNVSSFDPGAYTVKACGSDNAVSVGYGSFLKQFSTPPVVVTGVVGTGTYTMNWNTLPGAIGYRMYNGSNVVTTTIGTSYTFTGLTPNTSYTFGVAAIGNGIVDSTTSTVSITTKKTYSTPVTVTTGVPFSSFLGSQAKNGVVISVISDGAALKLVKYDLNTQTPTSVTLTSPGGSFDNFYLNTSSVNSDIYVVWRVGDTVTIQQYAIGTLSLGNARTLTFPNIAGYTGVARGARVISDPADQYGLKILTWGTIGGMPSTFVASFTSVNTNLAGTTETTVPLPEVTDQDLMVTPIKGSDNLNYYAMSFRGISGPKYTLFDSTYTQVDYATLTSLLDLAPSPDIGVLLIDGNRSYYMKPPSAFGGFSFSTSGIASPQGVIDATGKFYFYQRNYDLCTLHRYSAAGALLDTSDFRNGVTPSFGVKAIVFDAVTNQILVAQNVSGSLGFATFAATD